jgi:hypothetical protein
VRAALTEGRVGGSGKVGSGLMTFLDLEVEMEEVDLV